MEGRLLLKDCSIFRADGRVRHHMAVLVEGATIAAVAPDEELPARPGDWEIACRGRLVMSGLVDCHAHLVGSLLTPPSGELLLQSPRARFELAHNLESTLTPTEVEAITAFTLARALLAGVTLTVEHLYAPQDVLGALSAQARTAERIGARLVHSHATNSVGGGAQAIAQLEANAEHARLVRSHPLVRSALGFHASYTCDDDLLRRVGRLREELGVGAHYHLAEHDEDLASTYGRYGKRVVPRLDTFGLLGPGAVAAHANAIDRAEATRLARTRTLIALTPREMLVGQPASGFESLLANQVLIGLGTSAGGALREELYGALVAVTQLSRVGRLLDPDGVLAQFLVGSPAELCSMLFGHPSGSVEEGSLADLVVLDHVPAKSDAMGTPQNVLLQLALAPVSWTIVGGRVVVREGQLLAHDYLELAREANQAVEAVWARARAAARRE